jgi:predicted tellurium resistance membrane protein TerC
MYPNILLSILILLAALEIIGGMLRSHRLMKTAGVSLVLLVAASLILWLLMGLSPVPAWLTKAVTGAIRSIQSRQF